MLKPCVVYAKSESEAKRKLRELKKDAAKGLVKSTSRRFGDYADQWLYTFKLHSEALVLALDRGDLDWREIYK